MGGDTIRPPEPIQAFGSRPLTLNLRDVLDAILYIVRTGCQWRRDGTLDRIHDRLRRKVRTTGKPCHPWRIPGNTAKCRRSLVGLASLLLASRLRVLRCQLAMSHSQSNVPFSTPPPHMRRAWKNRRVQAGGRPQPLHPKHGLSPRRACRNISGEWRESGPATG
jgi:transposase